MRSGSWSIAVITALLSCGSTQRFPNASASPVHHRMGGKMCAPWFCGRQRTVSRMTAWCRTVEDVRWAWRCIVMRCSVTCFSGSVFQTISSTSLTMWVRTACSTTCECDRLARFEATSQQRPRPQKQKENWPRANFSLGNGQQWPPDGLLGGRTGARPCSARCCMGLFL